MNKDLKTMSDLELINILSTIGRQNRKTANTVKLAMDIYNEIQLREEKQRTKIDNVKLGNAPTKPSFIGGK